MTNNCLSREKFMNEIKAQMSEYIESTKVTILINILSKELQNIILTYDTKLPSVEVLNNNHLCNNYLASKKIEGASERTIKAYRHSIKTMLTYIECNIVDISTNDLRVFFARYGSREGVSGNKISLNTLDNMRRNLNSFFQWLEDEEYVEKNPCKKIKKIKFEQKIKTPLTNTEVEKIRDSCSKDGQCRELAIIDLLLSTGIRCEEVTKIKLCDCDFEKMEIKIHGKGAKERIVYMSDRCKLHLLEHISARSYESEYLFSNLTGCHSKLSNEGLSLIMRNLGKKAGVQSCQIHRFRKYFATTLHKRGCDIIYVQQLLGHAKLDTTKKHYLDIAQDSVHTEFKKFVA